MSTDKIPVIEFAGTNVMYPNGTHAIKNFNLKIYAKEFVFVAGSSGSGKSTLIRLLMKELEPQLGKVFVHQKDLSAIRRREVPGYRRGLGVVFQNFRLLQDRNVYDNVAISLLVAGASGTEIKKRVPKMLELVGLAHKMKAYPRQLSGGEQQRVALARALINQPEILLADEPTGNLDIANSWEIMNLFEQINQTGTTLFVVTHNNEIVDQMKKRVITLRDGMLVRDEAAGGYSYESLQERKNPMETVNESRQEGENR